MRSHDHVAMRRLAIAVLATAMYDAAGVIETRRESVVRATYGGKTVSDVRGSERSAAEIQREAYDWLTTPSERLEMWSDMAGLDMDVVIAGADAAIEYAKRTPRDNSALATGRRGGKGIR